MCLNLVTFVCRNSLILTELWSITDSFTSQIWVGIGSLNTGTRKSSAIVNIWSYLDSSPETSSFYLPKVYELSRCFCLKICCSVENLSPEWRAVNIKQLAAKFSKKQKILGLSRRFCLKICDRHGSWEVYPREGRRVRYHPRRRTPAYGEYKNFLFGHANNLKKQKLWNCLIGHFSFLRLQKFPIWPCQRRRKSKEKESANMGTFL